MAAIVLVPFFLWPNPPLPDLASPAGEPVRMAIHAIEYGVSLFLLQRAFEHQEPYNRDSTNPLLAENGGNRYARSFLIAITYAIFDEALQTLNPARDPSVVDLVADALGAAMAVAGMAILSDHWPQRRS